MPRPMRKPDRMPPIEGFVRRLLALRALLTHDTAAAGDQALKLLEEYLEELARRYGYADEGSLRRYAMFLRGRDALPDDVLNRAETYTDARNALAHTYGLQTTPELAAELVEFVDSIVREGGETAEQLMSQSVRTVAASATIERARDLMVGGGYGRLPVLDETPQIVGVLTERDLLGAIAAHRSRVADALPPDARATFVTVLPSTSRDELVTLLGRQEVVACLVTHSGTSRETPLGIITHADLLYRVSS